MRCVWASPWLRLAGLGASFGVASALLTCALRSALAVEPEYRVEIYVGGGAGPTLLLLLAWMGGGYLAGVMTERLGFGGITAIMAVGLCAMSALGFSIGGYRVAAGGVPDVVWTANGAAALAWLCGSVKRLYI